MSRVQRIEFYIRVYNQVACVAGGVWCVSAFVLVAKP